MAATSIGKSDGIFRLDKEIFRNSQFFKSRSREPQLLRLHHRQITSEHNKNIFMGPAFGNLSSYSGKSIANFSVPIIRANSLKKSKPELIFNIPSALSKQRRTRRTEADIAFDKKKIVLAHRIPVLSIDEIIRFRVPHYQAVADDLAKEGYRSVVTEILSLMEQEEVMVQKLATTEEGYKKIFTQNELFDTIVNGLKQAANFGSQNKHILAIGIRKTIAEHVLKMKDKLWLAKHLFQSCLELTNQMASCGRNIESVLKLRSEIKCILGYLEIKDSGGKDDRVSINETAMTKAIGLIEESRDIAKDQQWILDLLDPKVLTIKLKKPICLTGLREAYEIIDGRSMSLYSVSTLLLYEMLHTRVSNIIYSKLPEDLNQRFQSLQRALQYGRNAYKLAKEIHNKAALDSANMALGQIYLKIRDFQRALQSFTELQIHAHLEQDPETEAVAFSLIGCCYEGLNDPVNALENFVRQKEVAESRGLQDLELDALKSIGFCLLKEGNTVEAELCFVEAYLGLQRIQHQHELDQLEPHPSHRHPFTRPPLDLQHSNFSERNENVWTWNGVSIGLNTWGRLTGHCRQGNKHDLEYISEWKRMRHELTPVSNPRLQPVPCPLDSVDFLLQKQVTLSLSMFQSTHSYHQLSRRAFAEAIKKAETITSKGSKIKGILKGTATESNLLSDEDLHSSSRHTPTWKEVVGKRFLYDQGTPIIYESDLKKTVKKAGDYYLLENKGIRYMIATKDKTKMQTPRSKLRESLDNLSQCQGQGKKEPSSLHSIGPTSSILGPVSSIFLIPVTSDVVAKIEDHEIKNPEVQTDENAKVSVKNKSKKTDKKRIKRVQDFERQPNISNHTFTKGLKPGAKYVHLHTHLHGRSAETLANTNTSISSISTTATTAISTRLVQKHRAKALSNFKISTNRLLPGIVRSKKLFDAAFHL